MASFFFFYISLLVAVYVFTRQLLQKIQNLPPGPLSLPIIGHLYLLKRPLHRTLSNISNRYGPVVFLRFGSRPLLIVSSPSAAEECFSKNDIVFANRPRVLVGKYSGYNFTTVAWAPYGDHWRNLRRISSLELLSTHRLQTLSGIRREEVKSMIRRLFNRKDHDDEMVDLKTVFNYELTLNVMMRMIAGKRYYGDNVVDLEEAKRFRDILGERLRLNGSTLADFLPFIRWFGGSKLFEKSLMELQREKDRFMQSLIDQHKRRMQSSDCCSPTSQHAKKTMVEVLLKLQETEPEYYKDEIVRGLMLSMLVGGTETTSNTMEWSLSLLLNHPEILKNAQAEIDMRVGHDRLIDESDLGNLPYLQSIVNETLRMYPVAPLLVPHEASEECTVGGFRVPAGTMLFVNAWAIQNDPNIWKQPTSFKPERFDGFEGPRNGLKFMPFGSGRRGCPGEGLAIRLVGLVVGSLIQCFDWNRPTDDMVDMTEGIGFSLPKAQPLHSKCRPRPTMFGFLSKMGSNIV